MDRGVAKRRQERLGELVCVVWERLDALHRAWGRPPTAEDALEQALQVAPELAGALTIESGFKGSLSLRLNGLPWFGVDPHGDLGPVNFDVVAEPPNTPPVGSLEFAAGQQRRQARVHVTAAILRRQRVARTFARQRRPGRCVRPRSRSSHRRVTSRGPPSGDADPDVGDGVDHDGGVS